MSSSTSSSATVWKTKLATKSDYAKWAQELRAKAALITYTKQVPGNMYLGQTSTALDFFDSEAACTEEPMLDPTPPGERTAQAASSSSSSSTRRSASASAASHVLVPSSDPDDLAYVKGMLLRNKIIGERNASLVLAMREAKELIESGLSVENILALEEKSKAENYVLSVYGIFVFFRDKCRSTNIHEEAMRLRDELDLSLPSDCVSIRDAVAIKEMAWRTYNNVNTTNAYTAPMRESFAQWFLEEARTSLIIKQEAYKLIPGKYRKVFSETLQDLVYRSLNTWNAKLLHLLQQLEFLCETTSVISQKAVNPSKLPGKPSKLDEAISTSNLSKREKKNLRSAMKVVAEQKEKKGASGKWAKKSEQQSPRGSNKRQRTDSPASDKSNQPSEAEEEDFSCQCVVPCSCKSKAELKKKADAAIAALSGKKGKTVKFDKGKGKAKKGTFHLNFRKVRSATVPVNAVKAKAASAADLDEFQNVDVQLEEGMLDSGTRVHVAPSTLVLSLKDCEAVDDLEAVAAFGDSEPIVAKGDSKISKYITDVHLLKKLDVLLYSISQFARMGLSTYFPADSLEYPYGAYVLAEDGTLVFVADKDYIIRPVRDPVPANLRKFPLPKMWNPTVEEMFAASP
jgi:hypothetical protein